MALINAKNGQMVAAAALAAGTLAAQSLNTWYAKAQAKGLSADLAPEFGRLKEQLDHSQSAIAQLKKQLEFMDASLATASRTKIRWSIASFCLGLFPFTLKLVGVL